MAAFALNYCAECILATTPGITSIAGQGAAIYEHHMAIDTSMHMYTNLYEANTIKDREAIHLERSKNTRFLVRTSMKLRRNAERIHKVKIQAAQYEVTKGIFISWGFGDVYDEYFGEVNERQEPHGYGIKFFSDESFYLGDWYQGMRHTLTIAPTSLTSTAPVKYVNHRCLWQRPDGMVYEGTWHHDYKHGHGSLRYPDNSTYEREFAKGYEHGHGCKRHNDGSKFEGRFRFGRRDGQGTLTYADGRTERRIFREHDTYHEPNMPLVLEEEIEDEKTKFFQPETLLGIAVHGVAQTMCNRRALVTARKLCQRLQEFLKIPVCTEFLKTIHPRGCEALMKHAPQYGFVLTERVQVNHIHFLNLDAESILYFLAANTSLQSLELVNNRLDPISIDLLCKRSLRMNLWPSLQSLNLSFNKLDVMVIQSLFTALHSLKDMKILKLAGCHITSTGAVMVASYLKETKTLQEMDLAFNFIQAEGIEPIEHALTKNKTLTSLNIRQNNLGVIGGEVLVDALKRNCTLRILCVTDNKIGPENATAIAGRLQGTAREIGISFRTNQLKIPSIHQEKIKKRGKMDHH